MITPLQIILSVYIHRVNFAGKEEPHPFTKLRFEWVPAVSLIKAMFASLHTFVNSGIRHA